jgi:hypothetical protein
LTVRLAARDRDAAEAQADDAKDHTTSPATHWTCPDCGGVNDPEVLDCTTCPTGSRPGPHSLPD